MLPEVPRFLCGAGKATDAVRKRKEARRTARGIVLLLGFLIAPAVLAGSALAVGGLVSTQVDSAPEAATTTVTWTNGSDSRPVTIQVVSDDGVQLLAPAWSGLVTDVAPIVGKDLQTGSRVVQIDGVWRLASHTAQPFYRSIARGDSGWDVSMLNELLLTLQLPAGKGPRWSNETQLGVSRLAQDLGASSSSDTPFDPGWMIWLPNPTQRVGAVAVKVGAPAPAPGAEVARGLPTVVSAAIDQERSDLSGVQGAGWDLVVGDDSTPFFTPSFRANPRRRGFCNGVTRCPGSISPRPPSSRREIPNGTACSPLPPHLPPRGKRSPWRCSAGRSG